MPVRVFLDTILGISQAGFVVNLYGCIERGYALALTLTYVTEPVTCLTTIQGNRLYNTVPVFYVPVPFVLFIPKPNERILKD